MSSASMGTECMDGQTTEPISSHTVVIGDDQVKEWNVNSSDKASDLWARQITHASAATSGRRFADSSQTLIFLDWDDTLFPTSDINNRKKTDDFDVWEQPQELFEELQPWRTAVYQYLSMACSLTERCVIITNSRRPWVSKCINTFYPELMSFIQLKEASGHLAIVYATETVDKKRERTSYHRIVPVRCVAPDQEDWRKELMAAKHYAMKREAQAFYSQYHGQTWKNILSLGDMDVEHDAVQELTWRRVGPAREKVRTKAIILPRQPALSELTLRLKLSLTLLPAYVQFDGDIDIDTQNSEQPLAALAEGLGIPQIANIKFPLHAWGLGEEPSEQEAQQALDDLALAVHEELLFKED